MHCWKANLVNIWKKFPNRNVVNHALEGGERLLFNCKYLGTVSPSNPWWTSEIYSSHQQSKHLWMSSSLCMTQLITWLKTTSINHVIQCRFRRGRLLCTLRQTIKTGLFAVMIAIYFTPCYICYRKNCTAQEVFHLSQQQQLLVADRYCVGSGCTSVNVWVDFYERL